MDKSRQTQYRLFGILLGCILVIDQIVKIMVKTHMHIGEEIPLIGNWCLLNFTENNGFAFGISLGAQLNWYCYGRVNNKYEIGDHEYDINIKDIGYNPVTVDILGIIHVAEGFGIYCKYSPMNVMKSGRGPEYKSISVGLYFF